MNEALISGPSPADAIKVSDATRSGRRNATSAAIAPPIECPTR